MFSLFSLREEGGQISTVFDIESTLLKVGKIKTYEVLFDPLQLRTPGYPFGHYLSNFH